VIVVVMLEMTVEGERMSTTIHPQPLTPTWALLLPYEQVLAWLEHLRVLFDDISGWTVDTQAVFGELVRAVLPEAAGRLGATPVVMAPRAPDSRREAYPGRRG
jgi:hypothetical protein